MDNDADRKLNNLNNFIITELIAVNLIESTEAISCKDSSSSTATKNEGRIKIQETGIYQERRNAFMHFLKTLIRIEFTTSF